jgi:Phospholipase_D-nuclease N-terminal/zinc-ribbon domain
MKRRFLSVVPKSIQIGAFVILGCATVAGLVTGYLHGTEARRAYEQGTALYTMGVNGGIGLLAGVFIAIWFLCLGYIYTDARQRVMPPILWTLVAILVPNLLGFLLYFAMRRPLTVTCTSCGQAISPDQHFCSWCGHSQSPLPSGDAPSRPGSSGLDPITTV